MIGVGRVKERELGILTLILANFVFEQRRVGGTRDEEGSSVDYSCSTSATRIVFQRIPQWYSHLISGEGRMSPLANRSEGSLGSIVIWVSTVIVEDKSSCICRSLKRLNVSNVRLAERSALVRAFAFSLCVVLSLHRKTPWKLSPTRKANARARLKRVDAVIEAVRSSGVQCTALVGPHPT